MHIFQDNHSLVGLLGLSLYLRGLLYKYVENVWKIDKTVGREVAKNKTTFSQKI